MAEAPSAGSAGVTETRISLPAELGIEQAADWRTRLLMCVEEPGPVTLDARDVAQIHTAALQLFCMFCSDRRAAGLDTRWHEPSASLRSAAALLGVTTLLQMARQ
jgi:anti-anti-sigma regulatory factor